MQGSGLILMAVFCILACTQDQATEKKRGSMLSIPYEPAAKNCYQRIKKCNSAFRNGLDQMLTQARAPLPFAERLKQITDSYGHAMQEGINQPSPHTWSEEDVFLCCTFDLLKGMFHAEMKRILEEKEGVEQKKQELQDLMKSLESLPFSGPKWNHIVQPGIKQKLEEAVKQLP